MKLSHTKPKLVAEISARTELPAAQTSAVLAALAQIMLEAASKGETFSLPDVGRFPVQRRAARLYHNPSTGGTVKVPAINVLRFRPHLAIKEAVAQGKPLPATKTANSKPASKPDASAAAAPAKKKAPNNRAGATGKKTKR